MTDRYVLAVDQGTTSTRSIVFDRSGRMVAVRQREHRQHFPRPGWVEHDPMEIWANTQRTAAQVLRDVAAADGDVVALGIANQRETTVVWDRATGRPVGRALVWQDTRTAELVTELSARPDAAIVAERAGMDIAGYFAGPRLRWILDHVPRARERAEAGELLFGTMETWLIWNLTGGPEGGVHVTDVTNASRTLLMDVRTCRWDADLLAFFDVPAVMLPEIRPSVGVLGTATALSPAIPIAGALGDQQAALFGQVCFAPGDAKCTYGTGSFLLQNTGTELVRSRSGSISTVAYQLAGEPVRYALEGSVAVAGALVQWLRDGLGLIATAPEVETLARTVRDNGGCYVVPAFSGLLAPHWRGEARGLVAGLTGYVTKGHLARAALEATGWQTRDVVQAMEADSGLSLAALRVDGGMTTNNLLMQFVADVLDTPVVRPMVGETVSLGAAYAAGLAVGVWSDVEALKRNWHRSAQWTPVPARARALSAEYPRWERAVQLSIAWGAP
ncbi:glycerol kinase GlpK [Modestobacter sp. I12A-02628]|uniref:Glycerol kinase n=1 Tax=Goekera deserti TaxID=2497753 RepID=A0A7K3WG52_9ACTN|nr:glycerol kinase GlpK [Goekera deserti]MPR00398.1 glycerol kinase GlpK [Goekera deserti]NDI50398.1 glycerol kinase GlpK [Goekera deserti]NEL55336.1 glycerol kinase GlpK [Goekera deserti]